MRENPTIAEKPCKFWLIVSIVNDLSLNDNDCYYPIVGALRSRQTGYSLCQSGSDLIVVDR